MRTEHVAGYPVVAVCQMIDRYVLLLKGERILTIPPQTPEQITLFEKAANYVIPAYEGGWKRKEI